AASTPLATISVSPACAAPRAGRNLARLPSLTNTPWCCAARCGCSINQVKWMLLKGALLSHIVGNGFVIRRHSPAAPNMSRSASLPFLPLQYIGTSKLLVPPLQSEDVPDPDKIAAS